MRYPLLAFVFVFLIPLATASALVNGQARIVKTETASFSAVSVASAEAPRVHRW